MTYRDLVCGMEVADTTPYRIEHNAERYYFCSPACREKFLRHPEHYLDSEHSTICNDGSCDIPKPRGHADNVEYTCPMHPEVVQDHPGSCPKCGMALEPKTVQADEETGELDDMTRRLWGSALLTLPLFLIAMGSQMWPGLFEGMIGAKSRQWVELLLATPVVWWGGWPFFVRGWHSLRSRNLNMFTLIAIGVGVSWSYSLAAVALPGLFPANLYNGEGVIPVYFEASAVITCPTSTRTVMTAEASK